jgi:single-strand DNA-binding protein
MRGLNRQEIIGNVGRVSTLRYTAEENAVFNFSVAVGKPYKDKNGDWQDNTTWFDVVAWGKTAQILAEMKQLSVGDCVWLAGESAVKTYTDKNDQHKASIVITVNWPNIIILDKRGNNKQEDQMIQQNNEENTQTDDNLPF